LDEFQAGVLAVRERSALAEFVAVDGLIELKVLFVVTVVFAAHLTVALSLTEVLEVHMVVLVVDTYKGVPCRQLLIEFLLFRD